MSESVPNCFHCGLPCEDSREYSLEILGERRDLCCPGCQAVAEAIIDSGMESYYTHREPQAPGSSPAPELVPEFLSQLALWDTPELQAPYLRDSTTTNTTQITLLIHGITCAACVWLLEHQLQQQAAVHQVRVNLSNHRATIDWDKDSLSLSDLLRCIGQIGYKAEPYTPALEEQQLKQENRQAQIRIGVAGLGAMQVMMFAVGLYAGAFEGIAHEHSAFLRWVSALVCIPVYGYAGLPFLMGAWRNIKARHWGMDIPIAIAISAAFFASLWSTFTDGQEVYFDSVCMFIFFLSVGRYCEMLARHKAIKSSLDASIQAASLARVKHGDQWVLRSTQTLQPDDYVSIRAGETIPGDGIITKGESLVDEAMLTGEHHPINKGCGDSITGGTVNIDQPIEARITRNAQHSTLSTLRHLLESAHLSRPQITQLADKIASRFVLAVLTIGALTYGYWTTQQPDDAFWITLSVLVVTCPCALSLATPTAITTATTQLANQGLLPSNPNFFETLNAVTDVVFDKTGTLTQGKFSLEACIPLRLNTPIYDEATLTAIAAALERHSEHPLAKAFQPFDQADYGVDNVSVERNQGISAMVTLPAHSNLTNSNGAAQHYRIGTPEFCAQGYDESVEAPSESGLWIMLSDGRGPLAWFNVADPLRSDAKQLISALKSRNLSLHLLSGDHSQHPNEVASALGITSVTRGASPQAKLQKIQTLQQQNRVTLMVGDGLNDSPVLAGADVSIAMAQGSDLAKIAADGLLLNPKISSIDDAFCLAERTYRVIKQNLTWALLYNLCVLPAAVMGFIPPWLAALGMSSSSLIVVLNALRLRRG